MPKLTYTVEHEVQESWARAATVAWSYVSIAQDAYDAYLIDDSNRMVKPQEEDDPGEDYYAQAKRLFENSVKTVVFCGMALEAAIFDLAAIHLGDKYAREVVDKLDVLQKWLVVPRLVCGRALSAESPGINALRTVVRARNALVHAKSLPADEIGAAIQQMNKRNSQLEQDVHDCFRCIVLLSLELNTLLGTTAGVLPLFEKRFAANDRLTPRLATAIERARQIQVRHEERARRDGVKV